MGSDRERRAARDPRRPERSGARPGANQARHLVAGRCGACARAGEHGLTPDELDQGLEHESGVVALGGLDDPLGFAVYTYRTAAAVAHMAMALGGLDVLAFSGGVGENRGDVRDSIAKLAFLGSFEVEVVPAREELVIAAAVRGLIGDH